MSFVTLLQRLSWSFWTTTNRTPRPRPRTKMVPGRRSFVPRLDPFEERTLLSAVSFSPPLGYGVGSLPSAVAVADFNGDGKPDLVTANRGDNSFSVLLGNGDGTFQAAHNFAVGNAPVFVAAGDFNGDGKLDLVTANLGTFDSTHNTFVGGGVSVLLGNGDGSFQTAQNFALGGLPGSVAVGDFNGDGKSDLAVSLRTGSSGAVSILLGNGHGTFQTAQTFALGGVPASVAAADFNGDGKLDLAASVANGSSGAISVLLGNGDGTFQIAHNLAVGQAPGAVVVGDFNGDGKSDLAAPNFFGSNVSVLLGNGDGSFQTAQNFAAGAFTTSVAAADFNGDGKTDLTVGLSGTVSVLLGNGDGTFQTAQHLPASFDAGSVAAADFNGDGRPDLIGVNPSAFDNRVTVQLNQFATTVTLSGPTSSTYGQPATYTATVTSGAVPVTAGTVTFLDGNTPISPALSLDANGQAAFSSAALVPGSHTITAAYSGTPGGAGTTGFGASAASAGVTVYPAPLPASAVNFSAIAGAPFTGAVATFINADPFGSAASYTAIIDWGDGSTSTGTISGTGTLSVSGCHTYADPGSFAASVQISHNLGDTTPATVYPTALVTTLGQTVHDGLTGGIGFWHNKNGQALINAFNGGPDATALASWLAMAFPYLYGSLNGASNAQVAAFYQSQFALPGSNLAAELLATALNVYATTQSLGGAVGQAYGFSVTATGLGADSFNVGSDGAAFGVTNNATRNVYELLGAVDQQSASGVLYGGNIALQKEANDLFDALNKAGSI